MMPPNASDVHRYARGDALIIITRRATSPHKYEELIKSERASLCDLPVQFDDVEEFDDVTSA